MGATPSPCAWSPRINREIRLRDHQILFTFDHLGSVTAISDDTGNVFGTTGGAATTLFGYDAWAWRNPDELRPDPR